MKTDFKILHLFNDEKFIDAAIKIFEDVYPNKSLYYVLQASDEHFKYVKSIKAKPLLMQEETDAHKVKDLLLEHKIDVVFFHALHLHKQRIVNVLGDDILKVWFIWGFDLYWYWKLLKVNMFEKETHTFLYGKSKKTPFRKLLIFNNFGLWLFTNNRNKKLPLPKPLVKKLQNNFLTDFYKVVQKIDIVVPIVTTEFDYVKRINNKLIEAPFEYGTIEDLSIDDRIFQIKNAKNILIGNSASPSNNHVDAFEQIAAFKQNDQKVIVPLSYGGKKDYIDFVIEKGSYYFGEDFLPVLEFKPLKDYKQLISSCGFAVFNHRRQEALGNINTMGFFGAKLFLNDESPIFKYFNKQGIKIFNINKIDTHSFSEGLNEKDITDNKILLFSLYSKDAVNFKVSELLRIVNLNLKSK